MNKAILLIGLLVLSYCCQAQTDSDYDVAAYIWPSCHDDPMARDVLWSEGTGEWEVIKKGTPRFPGHYQPKVPLWGYELDNDPQVMEKWIDAATDHGVNVFIFDWYWYDEGPYLESSLNDGFLKASNNEKMRFYLMWANHDVARNYWNVHRYQDDKSQLWNGAVDWDNYKIIVDRIITQYFSRPNYYKIDGNPVFSVFSIGELLESFGTLEETRKALDYFREETKKAGFPDLHIQLVAGGVPDENQIDRINSLGANSVTQYNWGGPHREDYIQWGVESMERIQRWNEALSIPYFPNATIGWDDTPRFPDKTQKDVVHYNTSPTSFAAFLQKAKEYADKHPNQPKLITVFSWNEWVEGGYLLPDAKYGYGYLEAVRDIILEGKYSRYDDRD
ncbi:MAG: glycosyltransferase WbsX family protein [Sphingobacterium sp.]